MAEREFTVSDEEATTEMKEVITSIRDKFDGYFIVVIDEKIASSSMCATNIERVFLRQVLEDVIKSLDSLGEVKH